VSAVDDHPNAVLIRGVADAFSRGDLQTVVNAYADDGLYRVPGDNLVSGNYRGHKEIFDFFVHLGTVTGGSLRLAVDDVIGTDGHAVMFWRLAAEREDKAIDAKGAMAFKIDDSGKVTESWFMYSDHREYDWFYS
jgi:ketosteroid isomerase-like protein